MSADGGDGGYGNDDLDDWDDDFLAQVTKLETYVLSSSTNPIQPLPAYHQQQESSGFSPPRELSQRNSSSTKLETVAHDLSLPGVPISVTKTAPLPSHGGLSRADDAKEQEIERLKRELERVSGHLTDLEQECSVLRKEKDKRDFCAADNNKSANCGRESTISRADCHEAPQKFQNTKASEDKPEANIDRANLTSDTIKVPPAGVSDNTNLGFSDGPPNYCGISEKLQSIWSTPSYEELGRNVISRLLVICADDFRVIFGCMGINMDSLAGESSSHVDRQFHVGSFQSSEAIKVSYFYSVITKTGNGMLPLETLFEPLLDLCSLENVVIVHRSLCVLRMLLKHLFTLEKNPSRSALYSGIMFWWRENAPEKVMRKFVGMTAQNLRACFA